MHARALALIVALASVLAGCTAPPPEPQVEPTSEEPAPLAPLALARPAHTAPPTLPVSLAVDVPWLKPFREVTPTLDAPSDARVAWFIEHDEVDARASVVDDDVFVLKSTTPDHHNTQGPRSRADLLDFAPDGRARTLRVQVPGRYVLEAEGARLAINAWPDAPKDGPTQAFFVDADGAARFEPAEIDLPVGGRVLLWNQAGSSVDVLEVGFAAHLPLPERGGALTPIDEGLYHVVALAVDARGARGVARAGFLVDFERPSEFVGIGPIRGDYVYPETGAERVVRGTFTAHYPMRTLDLWFNATSAVPAPASIEVTLLHEGEAVATASSLTSRSLALVDAPAGTWAVEVRGEHGALVGFELTGEGVYRLPVPERLLRESTA